MAGYVFSYVRIYLPLPYKYSFTSVLTHCFLTYAFYSAVPWLACTQQTYRYFCCFLHLILLHFAALPCVRHHSNVCQALKKSNDHALYTLSIISWCLLQAHPSCSHRVWSLDKRQAHMLSACLRTRYVSPAQAMHVP